MFDFDRTTDNWLELPDGCKISVLKDSEEAKRILAEYEKHKNDPPRPKVSYTISLEGARYR